jgi:putative peptide zinc metalloprotease protein
VPRPAEGVTLIGDMVGSGYRVPPALARRGDGQTVQLTPMLYAVLSAVDGTRSLDDIATVVSQATGRGVSADNVRTFLDDTLRPAGLVATTDGSQPELQRSNPLLGLRLKYSVTDPERTRRLTDPFAKLFHPVLVVPIVIGFAVLTWWVLMVKGLASAAYQAFDRPGLLLAIFAITVLSAGWHEFGHAAGARYGGATPGVMGAGVYLIWPAFFTDVTDSYRLGRAGRVRTDLGGLYFNAMVAVATVGVWWATGWDAVLLLVATQILQMLRQLLPLVRFDGYHVLADVTGIPDLFQWIGPTLKGLLPWHWKDPEPRRLMPWARAVITAWVLAVVPMLAFALVTMVLTLPRMLGTAWASAGERRLMMVDAWGRSDLVAAAAHALAMAVVVLPVLAAAVMLYRLGRQLGRSLWTRTAGRPVRRAVALVTVGALVAALVWAWWPREGTYRPIAPWERGTLTDAVSAARPATGLAVGSTGSTTLAWPKDRPRPTRAEPQLALVLVPHTDSSGAAGAAPTATEPGTVPADQTWVFPVDQPLAPGEGDNQALAVNTTDGSTVYDTAFAMVWVEKGEPAQNVNEAWALASCTDCAAVSVAFQVVLTLGDTATAVPQNVAVSLTSDCVNCLTYALAVQLFVTLDGTPSEEALAKLDALWAEIAAYGEHLQDVPLSEIQTQLASYEQQIVALLVEDGALTLPQGSASPSPSASPSAGDSASASASDAPEETVAPTGAASTSPGASSSASVDPSDGPSSSPAGSPSASPTAESSPSDAATSGADAAQPTAAPTAAATP